MRKRCTDYNNCPHADTIRCTRTKCKKYPMPAVEFNQQDHNTYNKVKKYSKPQTGVSL